MIDNILLRINSRQLVGVSRFMEWSLPFSRMLRRGLTLRGAPPNSQRHDREASSRCRVWAPTSIVGTSVVLFGYVWSGYAPHAYAGAMLPHKSKTALRITFCLVCRFWVGGPRPRARMRAMRRKREGPTAACKCRRGHGQMLAALRTAGHHPLTSPALAPTSAFDA